MLAFCVPPAKPSLIGPNPPSARQIALLFKRLDALYPGHPLDNDPAQPFQVLVATILSARTKDPTTNAAMRRLWEAASGPELSVGRASVRASDRDEAPGGGQGHPPPPDGGQKRPPSQGWPLVTPAMLLGLSEKQIAQLIYPVGFYQTKARHLRRMSEILIETFDGQVPRTREQLMTLPGVGRKVANLLLNICWGEAAICVDIHVHRICNRLGWVATKTPEETEFTLMRIVPEKYWSTLNRVLVNHGQQICQPVSPWCSRCSLASTCPRIGVINSR